MPLSRSAPLGFGVLLLESFSRAVQTATENGRAWEQGRVALVLFPGSLESVTLVHQFLSPESYSLAN